MEFDLFSDDIKVEYDYIITLANLISFEIEI